MQSENVRNTVLFFVIAAAIMVFYQVFVIQPSTERERAAQQARAEAGADLSQRPVETPAASVYVERPEALALTARVPIATPRLQGSLSLQGARIDDLFLTSYRETLDEEAPVELFRPQGARYAYFAQFGWSGGPNMTGVPGPNTDWTLTEGSTLSPGQPVTLTYDNGEGLRFTRRIEVDEQYVFTLTDTVANLGAQAVTLRPYGSVQRQGVPDQARMFILHEGAIGVLDERLKQEKYKDWAKQGRQTYESTGGWLGITDKYWLASLLPEQDQRIEAEFRVRDVSGVAIHEANMMGEARIIEAGRQITHTQRLFAGAKRAEILRGYERSLDLPRFDQAIDWGMFWFLTRPIFMTVEWFYGLVGNFGVAILLLTVLIKLILFPLANKSYESLSRMRTLAPKLEEIKKKHGSDPQKQQQEMMALYQREKINPLAGCLPILLQIPVFYALYKVLFVTIEMRHAPFFGWIRDLSARDPSTIWNVFGLLPYDPATIPLVGGLLNGFLHLGVLPIIYGLTMWLQMSMNPPAPDPVQRKIFAFMPFVFTFILAPFAAGLLLYWAWNNILSIIQQYVIMHRFKAENPIDTFIDRFIKKKPKPS